MSAIEYKGHFLKPQKTLGPFLNVLGAVLGPSSEEQ